MSDGYQDGYPGKYRYTLGCNKDACRWDLESARDAARSYRGRLQDSVAECAAQRALLRVWRRVAIAAVGVMLCAMAASWHNAYRAHSQRARADAAERRCAAAEAAP